MSLGALEDKSVREPLGLAAPNRANLLSLHAGFKQFAGGALEAGAGPLLGRLAVHALGSPGGVHVDVVSRCYAVPAAEVQY